MKSMRLPSGLRAGVVIGAAIALLGFGVGATVASIPASTGAINACYSTSTGALRVIDYPSHHCGSGERFLRWYQGSPSSASPLAALQGSACSVSGGSGTLEVNVNAATGVVTLQCNVVLRVSSSVALTQIQIFSDPANPANVTCTNAKACSLVLPLGWTGAQVRLQNSADFTYTCPGALAQGAGSELPHTTWYAACSGIDMSANETIPVAPR
jgi:hypothetical protein